MNLSVCQLADWWRWTTDVRSHGAFLLPCWDDSESSYLAPAFSWVSEFITDSSLTKIPVI